MLLNDLRFALRTFAKKPAFFGTILLTLALGVGANTAMFSVFDAVVLKPLPFDHPERLTLIWQTNPHWPKISAGPSTFLEWKKQAQSFDRVIGMGTAVYNITGAGEPRAGYGVRVEADLFSTLGVRPMLGRDFAAGEDQHGAEKVVILNHDFWLKQFNGDPAAIGRKIYLNDISYTVIGVLPPKMKFIWDQISIWVPINLDPREGFGMYVLGRLKPNVSIQQADLEMKVIERRVLRAAPESDQTYTTKVVFLNDYLVGDLRTSLSLLLMAVMFVLLIACANVASMLLARASARSREIAVRSALGAGRGALLRQLLAETMLLGLIGGLLGLPLAYGGVRMLRLLQTDEVPRLENVTIDMRVLAFTFAASLLTGLLFGLLPARRLLSGDLNTALRESGRSAINTPGGRLPGNVLVIAEIALTLMVLIAGALLMRTFSALQNANRGFRHENLLTFNLSFPPSRYPTPARIAQFFSNIVAAVEAIPGVDGVAVNANLPLDGYRLIAMAFTAEGAPPVAERDRPAATTNLVNPGYFRAIGMPLLRGRLFDARDREGGPPVVIVSADFERRYFPGQHAVGKHITVGSPRRRASEVPREIVGVVGNIRYPIHGPDHSAEFYMPFVQTTWNLTFFMVHTKMDPSAVASAIRAQVAKLDKEEPISDMRTMTEAITTTNSKARLNSVLSAIFAALALLLAGVGIYGVISYSTAQRTREIGVRMALGAQAHEITGWILRQGLALAAAGAAFGLAGYAALARILRAFLYGAATTDIGTIAGCTLLLGTIAMAAVYVPARRAVRINPVIALREE